MERNVIRPFGKIGGQYEVGETGLSLHRVAMVISVACVIVKILLGRGGFYDWRLCMVLFLGVVVIGMIWSTVRSPTGWLQANFPQIAMSCCSGGVDESAYNRRWSDNVQGKAACAT